MSCSTRSEGADEGAPCTSARTSWNVLGGGGKGPEERGVAGGVPASSRLAGQVPRGSRLAASPSVAFPGALAQPEMLG